MQQFFEQKSHRKCVCVGRGGLVLRGVARKTADAKQVQDEMKQKKQCRKYLWLA